MTTAKRGRPKKEGDGSTEAVLVRVTVAEKQAFRSAAEMAGLPLSAWVRERLRRAARMELESAGQQIPFVRRERTS